jgi:hypothetical protein
MTNGHLRRALDSVTSSYVIAKWGKCLTCGKTKDLTNSHFFRKGGGRDSVRWMEANLWCQCDRCNRAHSEYREDDPLKVIFFSYYNEIQFEQLRLKSREVAQFREPHLQIMLGNWERKLARLLQETHQTLEEVNTKKYKSSRD